MAGDGKKNINFSIHKLQPPLPQGSLPPPARCRAASATDLPPPLCSCPRINATRNAIVQL